MKTIICKIKILLVLFFAFSCKNDDNGGGMPPEATPPPTNPELSVQDLTQSVPENQEVATVVAQFSITQENLSAPLVFELLEVSRIGAVTVNNEGQLLVADATAFDFERREIITGQVRASSGELTQTASFTLNINDVAEDAVPFVTRWILKTGGDLTVKLPLYEGTANDPTAYDFRVDWGDGSPEGLVTSFDDPDAQHSYRSSNTVRTVTITGVLKGFSFGQTPDSRELFIDVEQWGDVQLGNAGGSFKRCGELRGFTAIDTPILKETTNMSEMFFEATSFNGDISNWNVSQATNMDRMFATSGSTLSSFTTFNGDISGWDVSNVKSMRGMFEKAQFFQGDLSQWDVSNVNDMSTLFRQAISFNANISDWDVSNVTNMGGMFINADAFDQDLSNWDVSNVTNMASMFGGKDSFNGNISDWDVSNVTNMFGMFSGTDFDEDISGWDVSSVENMSYMFSNAIVNSDISNWNVSQVTSMEAMFQLTTSFNQDLSAWDVSSVVNMNFMFQFAMQFNGDISNWDVSSVIYMNRMFEDAPSFNQDISTWDVSSVNDMSAMFQLASSFNQDLSNWPTDNVFFCDVFDWLSALAPEHLPTRGSCF